MKKKLVSLLLVFVFVFSSTVAAQASEFANESTNSAGISSHEYSMDDILALEYYISIDYSGLFYLDIDAAISDGIDGYLVDLLIVRLEYLNRQARASIITINDDLSVDRITSFDRFNSSCCYNRATPFSNPLSWSCMQARCRGGRNVERQTHWWGYSVTLCDANTHDFSHTMLTLGIVAGFGGGVAGALMAGGFGSLAALPGAYWALLGTRASANNHGRGVHLSATWLLVFSFTPQ